MTPVSSRAVRTVKLGSVVMLFGTTKDGKLELFFKRLSLSTKHFVQWTRLAEIEPASALVNVLRRSISGTRMC